VRLIRWTTEASDQLEAAVKHILQENPTAARNIAQAFIERIEQLAAFPGLGRPGEVTGTRELVRPPYVVVYRSTEEIVEILYIWHGAQDWR
jgi:plasmid stabilization system protein ParE